MSMPVVILAGGLATRLRPLTDSIPKSLTDVGGRPFAVHQVELLRRHGLTDITFLVGHLGEMISDALGDGSQWDVQLRYVFDGPRRLGTGGAIRKALTKLGDPFFVLYGDSYLECDYATIGEKFLASKKHGLMTVYCNNDELDRSNVQYIDGRIVSYAKEHRAGDMRHIDYGLGAFWKSAFRTHADDESFDLVQVYQDLVDKDDLIGIEVFNRFYEIGSPKGLEETRAYIVAKGTSPNELRDTTS